MTSKWLFFATLIVQYPIRTAKATHYEPPFFVIRSSKFELETRKYTPKPKSYNLTYYIYRFVIRMKLTNLYNDLIFGSLSKHLIFLILLVLILPACKTGKRAGQTVRLKSKSSKYLLKKLAANRIEAEWLSAKAKITYKDDHQTRKFIANIRYRKDSLIWLNIKKTSVEAARIQITRDSFYFIDRLNKEYFINSIDNIEDRFNLPQRTSVDITVFDMLQEMLLGNPVFFAGSALKSSIDESEYLLKGNSEHFDSEYRLEGINYLLTAMNFLPDDNRQFLKIEMDRSDQKEEYPKFSYFRTYKMSTPKQGDIELKIKFSKLELNSPKTIRFEIPKSYTRIK